MHGKNTLLSNRYSFLYNHPIDETRMIKVIFDEPQIAVTLVSLLQYSTKMTYVLVVVSSKNASNWSNDKR